MPQDSSFEGYISPSHLYSAEQAAKELRIAPRTLKDLYVKTGKLMVWRVTSKKYTIPGWALIQLAEENLGKWDDTDDDESE